MKIHQSIRLIKTTSASAFHDLTTVLKDELKKSGIKNGILIVSALHTTCSIVLQESDKDVHADTLMVLDKIMPEDLPFRHVYEGIQNAKGHQAQAILGSLKIIPVKDGSLILGSWQTPYLIEFFKGMERKVFITILGV